jgi:hypothetical protein
MGREYKINKLKLYGYTIRTLGKSIAESRCVCVTKDDKEYRGSVNKIYNEIFPPNKAK